MIMLQMNAINQSEKEKDGFSSETSLVYATINRFAARLSSDLQKEKPCGTAAETMRFILTERLPRFFFFFLQQARVRLVDCLPRVERRSLFTIAKSASNPASFTPPNSLLLVHLLMQIRVQFGFFLKGNTHHINTPNASLSLSSSTTLTHVNQFEVCLSN
jgi:hypothetical protein